MTGFDSRTAFFRNISLNDGGTYTISNTHGALIRAADCTSERYCMSYLLDMHPGSVDASYPPNRVANAYLFPGESFEVPLNNISIQVLSVVEGESLSVKIRSTQPEKDNFWILVLPAILNDSQSL
ncbi:MAG: hypothetical protein KJ804_10210 [Proteobacteria bacterium]|nr:hypothetical protein [Pseudomonadota bacterium]MBU1058676.1 hypothetical protein [Pseudomonadota bacterium]